MFGITNGQMVKLVTAENGVDSFHQASYSVEWGSIKWIVPKKLGFIGGYGGHLRGEWAENIHGKPGFKVIKASLKLLPKRELDVEDLRKSTYMKVNSESKFIKRMKGWNALPCDKDY